MVGLEEFETEDAQGQDGPARQAWATGEQYLTSDLWRTTFAFSPVAMAELDLDGTIMRANAAAGKLAGRRVDEMIGVRTTDLGTEEERATTAANIARLARGEVYSLTRERRVHDRHGNVRWLSVHTSVMPDPSGAVTRLLVQMLDVTEAHELSERLQRSLAELDGAYREKAALMTALSHDLRGPLAAVRILSELLVAAEPCAPLHERLELAQGILAEATRTEQILGDLVSADVSADGVSAGTLAPRRLPVDLNDVVARVVSLHRQPGHRVVAERTGNDATVSADPTLLERLLANLVGNAIKHTDAGSTVWVAVRSGDPEQPVEIEVADNGRGVPDGLRESIFEPFVRAGDDRPGSGIGLFLVRTFAEFHGGSVEYADREGGGASFRVTLPRG